MARVFRMYVEQCFIDTKKLLSEMWCEDGK